MQATWPEAPKPCQPWYGQWGCPWQDQGRAVTPTPNTAASLASGGLAGPLGAFKGLASSGWEAVGRPNGCPVRRRHGRSQGCTAGMGEGPRWASWDGGRPRPVPAARLLLHACILSRQPAACPITLSGDQSASPSFCFPSGRRPHTCGSPAPAASQPTATSWALPSILFNRLGRPAWQVARSAS